MRALLRLVGLFSWNLALALGWLAFALIGALTLAEKSGLLTRLVESELRSRAGSLSVSLAHARMAWFETRLELEGLELGERGELARLEHVQLSWRIGPGWRPELRGVDVRDGRVWIARETQQHLLELLSAEHPDAGVPPLPPVSVRGVAVELDLARQPRVSVGRLEARLAGRADGGAAGEGALQLAAAPLARASRVYLRAELSAERHLALELAAADVPLSKAYLPSGALVDTMNALQPVGSLALDGRLEADLGPEGRARGRLRLGLSDGSLYVASGREKLEKIALDLDSEYEGPSSEILAPLSWQGALALAAEWQGVPFQLSAELAAGRAFGSAHVRRLPLDARLLAFAAPGAERALWQRRWDTFAPGGSAELWAAFELSRAAGAHGTLLDELRLAAELDFGGDASLSYLGWPHSDGREAGFPLALRNVRGALAFGRDPARKRPNLLGLVGLISQSDCGEIRAQGTLGSHAVDAPPFLPGYGASELDLTLSSPRLEHGAALDRALEGLAPAVPPDTTWRSFQPRGGALDGVSVRLVRAVDMPWCACELGFAFEGFGLSWQELRLPLGEAHGRLAFRSDGKGERALAAHLDASLRAKDDLALALRMQTDAGLPAPAANAPAKDLDQLSLLQARVTRLSLVGDERKALVARFADVGPALERMKPKGFADATIERVQPAAHAPAEWQAELTPVEVELQPQSFRVNTRDVRGRVLVTAREPREAQGTPAIETALAPLYGRLGKGADALELSFDARFGHAAAGGERVELRAAGIDLQDKNVLGALGENAGSFDLGALAVGGRIDLEGGIVFDGAGTGALDARLFLRGNTLSTAHEFRLRDLRGVLHLEGTRLSGEVLHAALGGTEVTLSQVSFRTSDAAGPASERSQRGFVLQTHIAARALPLDRAHLSGFVDKSTLDSLLDRLLLSGTLDIDDGLITIRGNTPADSTLEFRGKVSPTNTSIQLGLPWVIHSATAYVDQLLLEGGKVRARAHVEDLFGQIAGRELDHANLLLTYVEPRLSIEDISAEFEGGRLRPLGAAAQRSGTAFSIGFEEPNEFQLALEFDDVDVGRLLHGLFVSDFATRGKLKAQLRLTGNTEQVLDIQGSGSLMVRDSRLWSIPVFRELFSQLGLDNAAVFDQVYANVRVRDGRVELSDIAVDSPILKLRGKEGQLGFDGDMRFDLQLRYDLIDRLGPFTRLFYWIQKELLSVSIRGDMARPSVVFKNPFSALFGGGKRTRALPLPPFAPLPPRF